MGPISLSFIFNLTAEIAPGCLTSVLSLSVHLVVLVRRLSNGMFEVALTPLLNSRNAVEDACLNGIIGCWNPLPVTTSLFVISS